MPAESKSFLEKGPGKPLRNLKNREDAVDFEIIGRRTRPKCLSVLNPTMRTPSLLR